MTDESLASVIKTQNLIFDVNGTLIDSKREIANAQLYVFRQFGMHQYTSEEIDPHIGKTNAEIHRFFLPSEFYDRVPEAHELFVWYYRPRAFETTTLFPGVKEVLEKLHHSGAGLAVAP